MKKQNYYHYLAIIWVCAALFSGCNNCMEEDFEELGSKTDITANESPSVFSTGNFSTGGGSDNGLSTRNDDMFSDIIIIDPIDGGDEEFACSSCDILFDGFDFPTGLIQANESFSITGVLRNVGAGSFSGTVNLGLMIDPYIEGTNPNVVPSVLEPDTYYALTNLQLAAGEEREIQINLIATSEIFYTNQKNVVVIWPNNIATDPSEDQVAAGIVEID